MKKTSKNEKWKIRKRKKIKILPFSLKTLGKKTTLLKKKVILVKQHVSMKKLT